ncbi:MAG TPA: amidohydrolase [Firmicutes bacterium]|nr:amidohydrolase [Bacillota bacterium]
MPKDLRLGDFVPQSELVVERRKVPKPRYPVIDIHAHFGPLVLGPNFHNRYDTEAEVAKFKSFGVEKVVAQETVWGTTLDQLLEKIQPFEDFILVFSSVDVTKLDEPNFEAYVQETLQEAKEKGVLGLKFWKDISLAKKDKQGNYIAMDDERLKVIWREAAELGLPVLVHIGDPVAFFKPVDASNERFEELTRVPEWSFYKPGLFTFQELMKQQENLLRENPDTTFIIAHGASYSENLGQVSLWLKTYPNLYIDFAARLAEIGRQPYTARQFFIEHQDRILFGIDAVAGYPFNYTPYFEFLETWNEYFDYSAAKIPGQGRWKIYGIGLPDDILEKIYSGNAKRLLGL